MTCVGAWRPPRYLQPIATGSGDARRRSGIACLSSRSSFVGRLNRQPGVSGDGFRRSGIGAPRVFTEGLAS